MRNGNAYSENFEPAEGQGMPKLPPPDAILAQVRNDLGPEVADMSDDELMDLLGQIAGDGDGEEAPEEGSGGVIAEGEIPDAGGISGEDGGAPGTDAEEEVFMAAVQTIAKYMGQDPDFILTKILDDDEFEEPSLPDDLGSDVLGDDLQSPVEPSKSDPPFEKPKKKPIKGASTDASLASDKEVKEKQPPKEKKEAKSESSSNRTSSLAKMLSERKY